MLNRVILMGRIVRDLELRSSQSGMSVLRFTMAVDRNYVKQGEERQSDFISCVAFGQQAEFINRYFGKGRMIAIEGNIRTGSYEKDGVRHYTTEVYVDSVSFTGERATGDSSYSSNNTFKREAPTQQAPAYKEPASQPISVGSFDDFEELLSDDGVPF